MRFSPDSVSGQRLMANGVGEAEIAATRFIVWDKQKGYAITLPLPFIGMLVFIKRDHLVLDDNGNLADSSEIRYPIHELCHSTQALEWGVLRYYWRHVTTRIKTRDMISRESDVEVPCYQIEANVKAKYERPSG